MMAGSISESVAVIFVLTSSSKNSATLFSMAGSAPVDSPTSIMSVASAGKHSGAFSDPESGCPSRTLLPAFSTRASQKRRVQRIGRGLHRLHQRDAAGQQRAQNARELRDLVLQPDLAGDRQLHLDAVDASPARTRPVAHQRNRKIAHDQPAAKNTM